MKVVSQEFKDRIRQNGRILGVALTYYDYTGTGVKTTIYWKEHIFSAKIVTKGNIFSTLMKQLIFESDVDFEVATINGTGDYGNKIRCNVGVKTQNIDGDDTTDNYEFVGFGYFYIVEKEYNSDTKTYTYTCYDEMVKTMIPISSNFDMSYMNYYFAERDKTTGKYYMTIKGILKMISNLADVNIDLEEDTLFSIFNVAYNSAYIPDFDKLKENCTTYRDVLDLICQFIGINLYITGTRKMMCKALGPIEYVDETIGMCVNPENPTIVDTIDESFLSDKNITFEKLQGPINKLIIKTNENNEFTAQDNTSISKNGLTEFVISNNVIFSKEQFTTYGSEIASNLFYMIKNASYYICDFSSTGICYLDFLDYFNVKIGNDTYKCLLLNDEITIKNGLTETIYTEKDEEMSVSDNYSSTGKIKGGYVFGGDVIVNGNISANNLSEYAKVTDLNNYAPKNHASSATTYGIGTASNYGHNKVINNLNSSSYKDGESLSAYQGYLLNQNKAPNNHASSETTYGVGTKSNYGHIKLVDGPDQTNYANGVALSAHYGRTLHYQIYYAPGDTFESGSLNICAGFITSSAEEIQLAITTPKVLNDIKTITFSSGLFMVRYQGYYIESTNGFGNTSAYKVECSKQNANTIFIKITKTNSSDAKFKFVTAGSSSSVVGNADNNISVSVRANNVVLGLT